MKNVVSVNKQTIHSKTSISLVKKIMWLIQNISQTCAQTDESFFIRSDAPMNDNSNLSDFSDD